LAKRQTFDKGTRNFVAAHSLSLRKRRETEARRSIVSHLRTQDTHILQGVNECKE